MKRLRFVMALAMAITTVVMFSTPLPACAQETNPCAKDFKEVCSDVTRGGGRLLRCYEERKDKMSAACVAWAERAKANVDSAKAVCAKEINSMCTSAKGDPLAMVDCLQSSYIDLSFDCRVKLNQFKGTYPKPNPDQVR